MKCEKICDLMFFLIRKNSQVFIVYVLNSYKFVVNILNNIGQLFYTHIVYNYMKN